MEFNKDKLVGPAVSVILNVAIVIALYKFVVFAVNNDAAKIEVMVMEVEDVNLDELKEQLEELEELDNVVDSEVITEVEMETEAPDVSENTESVDDFQNLDVMNDFSSPVVMKGLFANRSAAGRAASLRRYAGRHGEATESAVIKALEWLRINQRADGSWESKEPIAITSLGLMAFLAHGETPSSEKYGTTVEKAIKYVLSHQKPDGLFKSAKYTHPIATYGLSEAYAMTRIPSLKPAITKAVDVIASNISIQAKPVKGSMKPVTGLDQPGATTVNVGGFGYDYAPNHPRWDNSVNGWHAQALKAAKLAGVKHPKLDQSLELIANGTKWFQQEGGKYGYAWKFTDAAPTMHSDRHMTAVGVLALQLLGHSTSPEVSQGLQVLNVQQVDIPKYKSFYYRNYYVTQAKFHAGKGTWKRWNNEFAPAFIGLQKEDGSWETPFDIAADTQKSHTLESHAYGKAYTTSLAALSLMVYYRNLPTFQEKAVQDVVIETTDEEDVDLEIL